MIVIDPDSILLQLFMGLSSGESTFPVKTFVLQIPLCVLCFLVSIFPFNFFLPVVNNELPPEIRLASGQLMGDDLSLLTAGELSPYISDPALKLFQCAVCNKFTSDSLEALSVHVSSERALPEEEWRAVIGDIYQCKLCNYNTQLKANFQLHCKTDKHMQKYQLVAHIKEGGKSNEWRLKCIAIGNPVHLKCNACDYYTNSVDKLRLHTTNHRHEAALKLYKVRVASLSFDTGVGRELAVQSLEHKSAS